MDELREVIKSLLGLKKLPEGDGLTGFTDEQLAAASEKAQEVFAEAREKKDVETATSAHAVVTNVKTELEERATAAAQIEEELNKLAAEITVSDQEEDEEKSDDGNGDDGDNGDSEPEAEPQPVVVTPVADAPEPVAVAAAVTPAPASKPRAVPASSAPPKVELGFSITAGADLSNHSAGTSLTAQELGVAFAEKATAVKGGRVGGRTTVAKVKLKYPDEYVIDSTNTSFSETQDRIDEVVAALRADTATRLRQIVAAGRDQEQVMEITAAGGFCAPFTPRYDICQQGDDVRPLRDSLPTFNATRGGIIHLTPPVLADVDGAVNVYTEEQDTSGYDYPKGCIRVDCGEPIEDKVQAITLCMEVGNFQRLSFPENFRAWWHYGQVAHARTAETELWDAMVTRSTARTANIPAAGLSATRNTLSELERYVQQMRYALRSTDPLRMWIPEWVKAPLRADLSYQMPGDNTMGVTDATLTQYLAARGIAVTYVLDGQSPNSGDTAFPTTVKGILALEGTFLRLDMGVLDFGTEIRDFTQIRQNDVGAFMEIFEGLAKVCNGPQVITLPIHATGRTADNDISI